MNRKASRRSRTPEKNIYTMPLFDGALQDYFGLHKTPSGYLARVYAPSAREVTLEGDFNTWSAESTMERREDGVFECAIPEGIINIGDKYKFKIKTENGEHYKSDPFALEFEAKAGGASVVSEKLEFEFDDEPWMQRQKRRQKVSRMNVYQLDLPTWRSGLGFKQLADELAPYLKQMGYTHLSASGALHTCDRGGAVRLFSPNAMLGGTYEFCEFVKIMHCAGIGVIVEMPWERVSADESGLADFDGSTLYECEGRDGGKTFDIRKKHVREMLISSALFWINNFHLDGIRLKLPPILEDDAGSTRQKKRKAPDPKVLLCSELYERLGAKSPYTVVLCEDVALREIAEREGNSVRVLTEDSECVRKMLAYCSSDPIYRKYHHEDIISPFLAVGRGEVISLSREVCSDVTLIESQAGDYKQKFAGARALLFYLATCRGKLLTFAGSEIAQFQSPGGNREIEWFLLGYDSHARFQLFSAELSHLCLSRHELWGDRVSACDLTDADRSVVSFRRAAEDGEEVAVAINFTPVEYDGYRLGVGEGGVYEEIFCTDAEVFGGESRTRDRQLYSKSIPVGECRESVSLRLPGMSGVMIKLKRRYPKGSEK